jgi:hypothetical protein
VNFSDYETLVAAMVRDLKLAGASQVFHQREFVGKRSGRKIKVDVSFETNLSGFTVLFLVECKCYNHMVDVSEVEEFITKIDDIGAHKGIMLTTVGFQAGAIQTAKAYGIGLARMSETARPGDMHVISTSMDPRIPPMERVAGEVLSGALYIDVIGVEGWKWFPCGKALLNELFLVDYLTPKKPVVTKT